MVTEASGSERWVICPVCHKGNPAGTRFCQHCWGAALTLESEVTSEELEEVNRRREAYLKRTRITRFVFSCFSFVAFLAFVFVFLVYCSDVFIKPPAGTNSDASSGDWAMFRRDLRHTGASGITAGTPEGIQKWVFSTGDSIHSSPAVVDGTVYFGSSDHIFYAVDANTGAGRWKFETGSWIQSSPAVVDGIVYFGSNDSSLYAVDAENGDKIWSFPTGYPVQSSPAVTGEAVYFRSDNYYVYALGREDGKEIWKFNTHSPAGASLSVADGIVIVGSGEGYCYCLNAGNGQRRLRFNTHYSVSSSPAVRDGAAYFATDNGHLYVIDYSARTWLQEHEIAPYWIRLWAMGLPGVPMPPLQSGLLWGVKLVRGATSSSPLVTDDSVYIGADNKLIAIDIETHQIRWEFDTDGIVRSSPAMAGSAVIFGSEDGRLYAVDSVSGEKLWDFTTGGKVTASPAVVDGIIYVTSHDGNLYAIE